MFHILKMCCKKTRIQLECLLSSPTNTAEVKMKDTICNLKPDVDRYFRMIKELLNFNAHYCLRAAILVQILVSVCLCLHGFSLSSCGLMHSTLFHIWMFCHKCLFHFILETYDWQAIPDDSWDRLQPEQ